MALPRRKVTKKKPEVKKPAWTDEYCFNCKLAEWNMKPENRDIYGNPFMKQCPHNEWRFLSSEKAKSCFVC